MHQVIVAPATLSTNSAKLGKFQSLRGQTNSGCNLRHGKRRRSTRAGAHGAGLPIKSSRSWRALVDNWGRQAISLNWSSGLPVLGSYLCPDHLAVTSASQKKTHRQVLARYLFACVQSSGGHKIEERPRTSSAIPHACRDCNLSFQIYVIIICKGLMSPESFL